MTRFTMKLWCAVAIAAFSSACGSPEVAKPGLTLQELAGKLVAKAKANGGVAQEMGAEGGTVKDASGAAIEIPAGALPQADAGDTFVVSVVPYTGAKLKSPEGFNLAGPIFEISIESVRTEASVQPLSAVRITVPYTNDAAQLAVGNYHASAWITKPTESIDKKASLVTASFMQLSPFGALRATASNTAPQADAQSVATDEDTALLGTLTGTDADGDLLSYTLAPGGDVQHGTLVLQINGGFTYTPAANYHGSDQFSFVVNDGTVDSQAAVVTITVNSVNDAPTLSGQTLTTLANQAVWASLVGSDVDGDTLTYSVSTIPAHGSVAITSSTGAFSYTPTTNYTGTDVFYVRANDGTAYSSPVSVTVKVNPFIRYVKPSATGTADGSSWANATADLQTAISDVSAAGLGEVWVAQGTYRSTGTGTLVTMQDNVDVYGGFAGTETSRAARGALIDPNATVLTGDTDSSGTFTSGDAYHVVEGASARLDSVAITGGNAVSSGYDARGGGVFQMVSGKTLKLSNVRIYGNHAGDVGGGVCNGSYLSIENSRIENNTSSNTAGGIYSDGNSYASSMTLTNTAVLSNTATGTAGGIALYFGTILHFSHGIVDGNTSAQNGGGIYVYSATATVANAQISNNTSTFHGAGIQADGGSVIDVAHVEFINNTAGFNGGGVAFTNASGKLKNSTFWGNSAGSGWQGDDVYTPSSAAINNVCAAQDLTAYGTAVSVAATNPFVTQAASREYFFDPAQGCSNWGDAATATTLFATTDTAWENWTSEISGTELEGSTAGVAAGMLHHPEDVWIRSFDVAASSLTWETNAGAANCSISNNADANVVQVGAADLPSGTQSHSLASGTIVTFSCFSARSFPKSVTGTVP